MINRVKGIESTVQEINTLSHKKKLYEKPLQRKERGINGLYLKYENEKKFSIQIACVILY